MMLFFFFIAGHCIEMVPYCIKISSEEHYIIEITTLDLFFFAEGVKKRNTNHAAGARLRP